MHAITKFQKEPDIEIQNNFQNMFRFMSPLGVAAAAPRQDQRGERAQGNGVHKPSRKKGGAGSRER